MSLSDPETLERLRAGAASLVTHGATVATGNQAAYALVDRAVRVQATTLALADNFRVAMACALAGALIGILLRPVRSPCAARLNFSENPERHVCRCGMRAATADGALTPAGTRAARR